MTKKRDQSILRFPVGLRDKIKEQADQNRRSMNAEIIVILENAIYQPKGTGDAQ